MTDEKQEPASKNESEPTKKPVKKTKSITHKTSTTAKKNQQKKAFNIGWLALILSLLLAVGGYYLWIQLQQKTALINQALTELQQNISHSSHTLEQRADTQSSLLKTLSNTAERQQAATQEQLSLLQKQVSKSKRQWLIAEAEHLANIANTQLLLTGDVPIAIMALTEADQRLKENGDPRTVPIRVQLAKEIQALNSIELPDIIGLSSQLIALESAISHFNIEAPHAGSAQDPDIGKETSAIPSTVQETLSDAWANFSKLIVIRRNDNPKAALMTPEQVELIRKNLALKLEAARLALIQKDSVLYISNLELVSDWLVDYFNQDSSEIKTALKQIQTIKNTPIKVELPSPALSLKMLRDLPLLNMDEITATISSTEQEISDASRQKTLVEPSKQVVIETIEQAQ